jgi:23S rRNA (pseudouridine1915-N3)-methyltransferase
MQIHIIAIGERMPDWVKTGFQEYAKRLPRECRLVLHEILPASAAGADVGALSNRRTAGLLPFSGARIVALDRSESSWTPAAAELRNGSPVAITSRF